MARPLCGRLGAGPSGTTLSAPAHPEQPSLVASWGRATSAGNEHTVCQTLVSLTLAQGEVPVPIALRLFLPETSGRLQTEVAAELGIQPSQLRWWQRRLR